MDNKYQNYQFEDLIQLLQFRVKDGYMSSLYFVTEDHLHFFKAVTSKLEQKYIEYLNKCREENKNGEAGK